MSSPWPSNDAQAFTSPSQSVGKEKVLTPKNSQGASWKVTARASMERENKWENRTFLSGGSDKKNHSCSTILCHLVFYNLTG